MCASLPYYGIFKANSQKFLPSWTSQATNEVRKSTRVSIPTMGFPQHSLVWDDQFYLVTLLSHDNCIFLLEMNEDCVSFNK